MSVTGDEVIECTRAVVDITANQPTTVTLYGVPASVDVIAERVEVEP